MTWPTVAQMTTAIPGDGFDGWQNYWNQWWIKEALLNKGTHFFFTDILYPPDGATLTQLHASILDAHNGLDVTVNLRRVAQATGTTNILGTITSSGTNGTPDNSELSSATFSSVVSNNYSYYITFCLDPNTELLIALFGARVSYTGP